MADEEVVETEETVAEEVVEQVEETATEEVVEEVEETQEVVEEEQVKAQLPKGVQKRIDKITRQRYDAEREVAALRQQLEQRPEAQPINTAEPTLEQFEFDDDKYNSALVDYRVNKALEVRDAQRTTSQQQAHQNEVLQNFEARRQQTLIQGVTAHDDFEEVAIDNPDLQITPQMADIITDSDVGHEIAYHLGQNVQEAAKIAQLTPLKQAAAIARIEAQLAAKPTKKISKASAPVKTVGSTGSSPTKIDPKTDYAKWAAERNKQQFGR